VREPTITFEIPGPPRRWERPDRGDNGAVFTKPSMAKALRDAKWFIRPAMRGREPIDCPFAIDISLFIPAAKTRMKQLVGRPHDETPDVDNFGKLILDAGNRLAWTDDRRCYQQLVTAWWSHPSEARTVVKVYAWDPVEQLKLLDLPKTKTLRTFA